MKRFVLYLMTLCSLFACNSNKQVDNIPLEAPEELRILRLQMGNELTRLFREDSVQWDSIIFIIDSAKSIFWYDPQFYLAEAHVKYKQGNKAESDSLLLHSRSLYDQRLRQRQDLSDAVNRAGITLFLYGREAFNQEIDSLITVEAYKSDSTYLKSFKDMFYNFEISLGDLL